MRILQVVALVSPSGDYGGPVRVALEQSAALAEAGHDVILAAGAWGYESLPTELAGVPLRLFPASTLPGVSGLSGLVSLGLLRFVRRYARRADVVHVHLGRDLVSLPAAASARRQGVPYVVQTHGMVQPTTNPLAPVLDALATRRVLRDARAVFYLTDVEHSGLLEVEPAGTLRQLRNGIALPDEPESPQTGTDVLFLARIQERKRPRAFVEMATRLAPQFPHVTFRLVGPDEGAGSAVRDAIARSSHPDRIVWDGPADRVGTEAAMARACMYVLPSAHEPYPMTVLEAMATGLPVVVSDTCGLAPLVAETGAGVVVGTDDADDLDRAVRDLLARPDHRRVLGRRARSAAQTELGMAAVVERLESSYRGFSSAAAEPTAAEPSTGNAPSGSGSVNRGSLKVGRA